jgi:hypothetical protein
MVSGPRKEKSLSNDLIPNKNSTSTEIGDADKPSNELFLAVLPLIHITNTPYMGYGLTEQTLTLFPDKKFATQFFLDEVDNYIRAFESRAQKYLTGGHVTRYVVSQEPTGDGRVIVRVVQHVS